VVLIFSTLVIGVNISEEDPIDITNPSPSDGAEDLDIPVDLSVDVSHEDGQDMDVSFYYGSGESLIGTDENVPDGGTATVEWDDLGYATTYEWYVEADDGDDMVKSDTWSFTTKNAEFETDGYEWDGITSHSDEETVHVDETPYNLEVTVDSIPDRSGGDTIIDNWVDFYHEDELDGSESYPEDGSGISYEYENLSAGTHNITAEWNYELGNIESQKSEITIVIDFKTDPYEWGGILGISDGDELLVDNTPYDLSVDVDSIPDRSGGDTILDNWVEFYINGDYQDRVEYPEDGSSVSHIYTGLEDGETYDLKLEWHYELGHIESDEITVDVTVPEFIDRSIEQDGIGRIGDFISPEGETFDFDFDFNVEEYDQIDVEIWYDETGGSSYPEIDEPLTRFHVHYDGTSWSLESDHPDDEVELVDGGDEWFDIDISEQLRYSSNSGSGDNSGTEDVWNIEWEAQFDGYDETITRIKNDEFGVDSYIDISIDVNDLSASGEPGDEVIFDQNPIVTYVANSEVEVIVTPDTWLEDNEENEIEWGNVYVDSDEMPDWENFEHDLDSEINLLDGTKDAPTEGHERTTVLDWKVDIPIGTPANEFSGDIEYEIRKTNPGGSESVSSEFVINEEDEYFIRDSYVPEGGISVSVLIGLVILTYIIRKKKDVKEDV